MKKRYRRLWFFERIRPGDQIDYTGAELQMECFVKADETVHIGETVLAASIHAKFKAHTPWPQFRRER